MVDNEIEVSFLNHSYLKIKTSDSIDRELKNYFKFKIHEFEKKKKFIKSYRNWDGYIHLYKNNNLPTGLYKKLKLFCRDNGYKLKTRGMNNVKNNSLADKDVNEFIQSLNLPLKVRDYQLRSVKKMLNEKRLTLLSPTSSGKTMIIYAYVRYVYDKTDKNIMIIVPSIQLVEQLACDFKEMGFEGDIHKIFQGADRTTDKRIVVSTWQSLYKEDKKIFERYGCVVLDEAHSVKNSKESKVVIPLIQNFINAEYRVGMSGTINDEALNRHNLEMLFGEVYSSISTRELIDNNYATEILIKSQIIEYPDELKKMLEKLEWQGQIEAIESADNPRQRFICDLARKAKNNTLILFRTIEHGKHLYELCNLNAEGKKVSYVDGKIDVEKRQEIKKDMESSNNNILIASYGTFSQGISIKNLHNLIFSSSYKSKIRILQSLGRLLRLNENKDKAIIYDVCDYFGIIKRHYEQRLEMYVEQRFLYDETFIDIKDIKEKYKYMKGQ